MDAVAKAHGKTEKSTKKANQLNRIKTYFSRVLLCLNRITRIYTQLVIYLYISKTFRGILVNTLQLGTDIVDYV